MSLVKTDIPTYVIDSLTDIAAHPKGVRKCQLYFLNGASPKLYACFNGTDLVEIGNGSGLPALSLVGVAASVDSEVVLFSGTTGVATKRATGTGFVKVVSGVLQTPAATIPVSVLAGDSTAVPATAGAAGTKGQIRYESGFLYVCVATNTWERVATATWP